MQWTIFHKVGRWLIMPATCGRTIIDWARRVDWRQTGKLVAKFIHLFRFLFSRVCSGSLHVVMLWEALVSSQRTLRSTYWESKKKRKKMSRCVLLEEPMNDGSDMVAMQMCPFFWCWSVTAKKNWEGSRKSHLSARQRIRRLRSCLDLIIFHYSSDRVICTWQADVLWDHLGFVDPLEKSKATFNIKETK